MARYELHLTDDEFLALSYRQFHLLHTHCLTLRWQDQWQQGAIWAAILTNGMKEYKKRPKADDLVFTVVPGKKRNRSYDPKKTTTEKQQRIADFFRSLGG